MAVTIDGLDDVNAAFASIRISAVRYVPDGIAEAVAEDARAHTPVATTKYTPPGHDPGTLKEQGIDIHTIHHDGLTASYIGYTQVGWYGIFLEFGTVHMSARPILVPALHRNRQYIEDHIGSQFKDQVLGTYL